MIHPWAKCQAPGRSPLRGAAPRGAGAGDARDARAARGARRGAGAAAGALDGATLQLRRVVRTLGGKVEE